MPKSAGMYFGLGSFLLLSPASAGGDIAKAGDYLAEAVAIDPRLADGYVRLAQVYQAKGSEKIFKKYLDKALVVDHENKAALDIKSKISGFTCLTTE